MAFESNWKTAMMGHTGYDKVPGGEEPDAPAPHFQTRRTQLDDNAEVRDILSTIVGGKYKSFANKDVTAGFTRLAAIIGPEKAQKLATHAFVFNNRQDVGQKSSEERLQSFFDMGSKDADVDKILTTTKNFATGVVSGYRDSRNENILRQRSKEDLKEGINSLMTPSLKKKPAVPPDLSNMQASVTTKIPS